MASSYMPPPDPKGELFIEVRDSHCVEVFFIPEDDRLREAGIVPKDRENHCVKLLEFNSQDGTLSIFPISMLGTRSGFLKPKYGRIKCITLAGISTPIWKADGTLPMDREGVLEYLENLPSGFTKDPDFGLGLAKDYRFIVSAVEELSSCTEILIWQNDETYPDEDSGTFYVSHTDFDAMRRSINSITSASQMAGRSVKDATIHNYVAERIGKPLMDVTTGRSPIRRAITSKAMGEEVIPEVEQDAVLHALSNAAKSLGEDQTKRLAKLQSDIELVTLEALIVRFEAMLGEKTTEKHWQTFFNENPFILNMAFGYPVIKVRDQASVGGRKLSGDGEKITDFLVKNSLTNNTAIFEIKTPKTSILNKVPFREGVFTPSANFAGSINQALDQKYQFQKQVAQIKENSRLYDIESYAVHCCLVIGTTPDGDDRKKSFELFRRNSKDVEIVTFDELLEKLKQLSVFLRAADEPGKSQELKGDTNG